MLIFLFLFFIFPLEIKSIVQDVPKVQPQILSYSKNEESARKFLQQYNSFNPVMLLIDDTPKSHNSAINFLSNLHRLAPKIRNLNFMIMKFNTSGASAVLESTMNNRQKFDEILNEKTVETSTFLGHSNTSTSAVFFGILNAVQVLKPNGGIVVFMERAIEDESLAQHALVEVQKKRIQVFVIWGGKREDYLLKELAMRSHGAFVATNTDLSETYFENFLDNIDKFSSASLLLSRKNLKGNYNLNFPVDSDVTSLHISISLSDITPKDTTGIITTPSGYNIDVFDDVIQFSEGSFVKRENGMHEIHLNTTTPASKDVGIWRFSVGSAHLFNVSIFAHTKLTTYAFVTAQNGTVDAKKKKVLRLGVKGDVRSINNISFVNKDGRPILNNVKFKFDKKYLNENIQHPGGNKQLNIDVEQLPEDTFYAVISGKDSQGNEFQRLSYVKHDVQREFYLPPITIDVGLGSELITQPYRQPQIFFEVTNNGNSPTLVRFFSRDERGILLSMIPWYKWINPQETSTVRVTLTTRPGSYQDFITFTAVSGSETVTKKVIVDVGISREDRHDPRLHYHFTSDCTSLLFSSCEDGIWTVEVKAKDKGSGLLQVISEPKGLFFPNGFTTGTTEEVTGYYSESCCRPELKLIAFDRQNNRETRHLNAYYGSLSPGAIAAIVLGILLFIIIIIAIICYFYKHPCKCWAKKDSYDLPVYRGPRRT